MHPRNIGCLTAAGASACTLANNHVLDWGHEGLRETLQTLDEAGVAHAGAGCDEKRATDPAVLDIGRKGRLLLFSFGSVDSGVAREWGATQDQPGINLLKDLSEDTASHAASQMRRFQQPGDMIVASVHWGSNWGYEIAKEKIKFAHRWIEEGIAIVHGHSSHHAKGIEVYRDHLILYGCGDFINDYEGITGYEAFRSDLNLMYLVRIAPPDGRLISTRLVPMNMRRFRLNRASTEDTEWLCDLYNRLGLPFGTQVKLVKNLGMNLEWEWGPARA
jgi:poly-gamma-glutamate capsule biosynthesis protein CapA/YwtB (metallophosphatase superfamily)